jgi:hypothetical protein
MTSRFAFAAAALLFLVHASGGRAFASDTSGSLSEVLRFQPNRTDLEPSEREKVRAMVDTLRARLPRKIDCLWLNVRADASVAGAEEPTEAQWRLAHERLGHVRTLLASHGLRNLPSYEFTAAHLKPMSAELGADAVSLIIDFDAQTPRVQWPRVIVCDWRPAW